MAGKDARERLLRTISATEKVSLAEMAATPGFMPTPVRRSIAVAVGAFVPVVVAVDAYVLYLNSSRPGYFGPPWAVALPLVFGSLLFAGAIWIVGIGMQPRGIAVTDEGVVIFDRPVGRSSALRRTISWASLEAPKLENLSRVWLTGDVMGEYLSYAQARAILLDPRCPWRSKLPPAVAAAIGAPNPSTAP